MHIKSNLTMMQFQSILRKNGIRAGQVFITILADTKNLGDCSYCIVLRKGKNMLIIRDAETNEIIEFEYIEDAMDFIKEYVEEIKELLDNMEEIISESLAIDIFELGNNEEQQKDDTNQEIDATDEIMPNPEKQGA